MFDKSTTWRRLTKSSGPVIRYQLGHVPQLDTDEAEDRRGLRIALVLAIAAHVLLFIAWRKGEPSRIWEAPERPIYVVQQVRFKAPPPAQTSQIPVARRKKRAIPMPDPTPDEPEPLLFEVVDLPVDAVDDIEFAIPEGAPSARVGYGTGGERPYQIGAGVSAPVKVFYPSPMYTEEARKERIQGVVILQAVIDAMGQVSDVEVVKGLPRGLSESAVETVSTWRFRPALLEGEPVPVYFSLTVSFSLQ